MGDIKLFDLSQGQARELEAHSVAIEKSLQTLIEQYLEAFLGVRFLATEYVTGKTHGGRIDTLGIDENGFPVIIEYKRTMNEGIVSQVLFYVDWLLENRAEFQQLVAQRYGDTVATNVDWQSPRFLCIAGNFARYDEFAVKHIPYNIELIRYRLYGENILTLELINVVTGKPAKSQTVKPVPVPSKGVTAAKTVSYYLAQSTASLQSLYAELETFARSLGNDVQKIEGQEYHAFRKIKNFLRVVVAPRESRLSLFLRIDPSTIQLEEGFTRLGDGPGSLEVRIRSSADLERAKPLIVASYEKS